MAASNAGAVQQIEDAGKKVGAEQERTRVAELTKVFGKEPDYLAECIGKEGFTVNDAKAGRYEALVAEVTGLKEENTKLREAAKEPKIEFAPSDEDKTPAAGQAEGNKKSSVDEADKKSVELWNKHAKLREAFNNNKATFQALYRHDPEEALAPIGK